MDSYFKAQNIRRKLLATFPEIKSVYNGKYIELDFSQNLALRSKALVFVYELSGRGFESSCSHLNFRIRACFEQGVP